MTKTRNCIKNINLTILKQGSPQTMAGRFECLLGLSLYFYNSFLRTGNAVSYIEKNVGLISKCPFNWHTNPFIKEDSPWSTPTRCHLSILCTGDGFQDPRSKREKNFETMNLNIIMWWLMVIMRRMVMLMIIILT